MLKLQVIIGSTRAGRNADPVLRWAMPVIKAHDVFQVETLDLRDWPLPFFQETIATVGDFANPTYSEPIVKRWNEKLREADAYVILSPEYNRSVPAVLKNAIDSVFFSFAFRHKPVAFISYSLGATAGARAVEHLSQIMLETDAVPVRTATLIPAIQTAFDVTGKPTVPGLDVTLDVMLQDLAWFGMALQAARSAGQPPPAAIRIRAARTGK
jgi:NAD(P)H-dependent FMN reductase